MSLILFDDHSWDNLLPLTFTRPASQLRIGIMTIAEKWEHDLGLAIAELKEDQALKKGDKVIALRSKKLACKDFTPEQWR